MSSMNSPKLVISLGPNEGKTFALTQPEHMLGRDAPADFIISAPGVSRQHARLFLQEGTYSIEDMNSSNGTYLNQEPLTGSHPLKHGDQIGLGQGVALTFEISPALKGAADEDLWDDMSSMRGS